MMLVVASVYTDMSNKPRKYRRKALTYTFTIYYISFFSSDTLFFNSWRQAKSHSSTLVLLHWLRPF